MKPITIVFGLFLLLSTVSMISASPKPTPAPTDDEEEWETDPDYQYEEKRNESVDTKEFVKSFEEMGKAPVKSSYDVSAEPKISKEELKKNQDALKELLKSKFVSSKPSGGHGTETKGEEDQGQMSPNFKESAKTRLQGSKAFKVKKGKWKTVDTSKPEESSGEPTSKSSVALKKEAERQPTEMNKQTNDLLEFQTCPACLDKSKHGEFSKLLALYLATTNDSSLKSDVKTFKQVRLYPALFAFYYKTHDKNKLTAKDHELLKAYKVVGGKECKQCYQKEVEKYHIPEQLELFDKFVKKETKEEF